MHHFHAKLDLDLSIANTNTECAFGFVLFQLSEASGPNSKYVELFISKTQQAVQVTSPGAGPDAIIGP